MPCLWQLLPLNKPIKSGLRQEEGRPSRWKDGLARSFLHDSTHHFRKERGSKRLTSGNPGAIGTRCVADLLGGTYSRCRGVSTDQTTLMSSQTNCSRLGEKLEQGPARQAASAECSGGVSADIGSSDLDEYTLVADEAIDNQLSCSLPLWSSTGNCGNGVKTFFRPRPMRVGPLFYESSSSR